MENNKSKGQEHAPEEQKRARHRQPEPELRQRTEKVHDMERLPIMPQPRPDGQVRDPQQEQDQKRADAHGPAEPDLRNEVVHHDGEDDAAQAAPASHDAQRERTPVVEPGHDGVGRGVEDGAGAERAAEALGQDELVVLVGDGGHHQAEDVEEGAGEEEPAGAEVVEEGAEERALYPDSQIISVSKQVGVMMVILGIEVYMYIRTPKNMTNVSRDGIHVTVLGDMSFN